MNTPNVSVAEMQGLYGAYSFSELLLQKIWLRGDFDRKQAVTTDGLRVEIVHPGQWNRLGGPDFKDARVRFGDGSELTGDVELHLRAEDWAAHRHQYDAAYNRVILHVVLFPPTASHRTTSGKGQSIPVLPLLTLLRHDLEEFAADDAVERLAARPSGKIIEELGALSSAELSNMLRASAEMRWRQKIHYARVRIERLGWSAACHQTALEILGYRFNRAPMLRVAERFSLEAWTKPSFDVGDAVGAEAGHWSLQGVRPANHPRVRLAQYFRWAQARPDWPSRVVAVANGWPRLDADAKTATERRAHALGRWRERVAGEICDGAVGGTRWDTLVIDGLLPLLAAKTKNEPELFGSWFHWFPGDLPPMVPRALRDLAVIGSGGQPAINGFAQGLLGWWWQREGRSASVTGRGA